MPGGGKARFVYRALRARFRDQRGEIRELRRTLRGGDVAVDVGANKGSYTYWMRRAVGKSGRVVAVEPQPELATYLRESCGALGWDNVDVLEAAASDRAGRATLRIPGSSVSPGASLEPGAAADGRARELDCETVRLDDVLEGSPGKVALVKVDVEGHELSVFRGAERILERDRPALLFECEARHLGGNAPAGVFAFLAERGYRGFFFSRAGLRPVAEFDPCVHQRRSPGRFWKEPGYVNNFLFSATSGREGVFERS
jgi:FkbM family methyltransferase